MRKAFPRKVKQVPTGVKNKAGKLITNPKEKKTVILDHFFHRMRDRPKHQEFESILETKKDIFRMRLELTKKKKSPQINMQELKKALQYLKEGKSRDHENLVTEIFKEGVIGSDLNLSLVMMFNRMKDEVFLPESLRTSNITMLHKKVQIGP